MCLFSDLPGFLAPNGGSIPPHILVTTLKPDIFLVNESTMVAVIFELTCPWDGNIDRSHEYKEGKYAPLVADLSRRFTTFHFSIEVSVRGQVTGNNRTRLKSFLYRVCLEPKPLFKSMILTCSKISLLSSFSIFAARNEPSWNNPPLLLHHWSYLLLASITYAYVISCCWLWPVWSLCSQVAHFNFAIWDAFTTAKHLFYE